MSTPNPLIPQGALPPSKGKSNVRVAIFTILAVHLVVIGGLLIVGCKPTAKTNDLAAQDPNTSLPVDLAPLSNQTDTAMTSGSVMDTNAVLPPATVVPNSIAALPAPAAPAAPAVVPPVTQEPVAAATGEMTVHSIAKGEMLATVAKKYGVTVKAIESANPNINPLRLQIGQKINIPAPVAKTAAPAAATAADAAASSADVTVYTVKPGDMLEKIARANGTTVKAIKSLNNLRTDQIRVNQKLKLPAPKTAAAPAVKPVPSAPTSVASATTTVAAPVSVAR